MLNILSKLNIKIYHTSHNFLMGQISSYLRSFSERLRGLFSKDIEARILMLGLDAAGKTTILYRLKLDENVSTIPTIGFNVETLEFGSIKFTVWDVGGQDKIRQLWKYYYTDLTALIYVVDSADRERLHGVAAEEFKRLVHEEMLKDCLFLIFGNKQDKEEAARSNEIIKALELDQLRGTEWYVQECSATNCEGLHEGLSWLVNRIKTKQSKS